MKRVTPSTSALALTLGLICLVFGSSAYAEQPQTHPVWVDPFLEGCGWFMACVFVLDFFVGSKGRAAIRDRLERAWLWFEYLPWKDAAEEEAKFTLHWIERIFGARTFSRRRLDSCLLLLGATIVAGYLAIESAKYVAGLPFSWPLTGVHFRTDAASSFIFVFVGIAITHWVCGYALTTIVGTRWATFKFVAVLCVSLWASLLTGIVVEWALKPAFNYATCRALNVMISYDFCGFALTESAAQVIELIEENVSIGLSNGLRIGHVTDSIHAQFAAAVYGYPNNFYSQLTSFFVIALRLCASAFFLLGWGIGRYAHRALSLVIYRFSESEKGILTLFAAALAGLGKLIQITFRT